MRRKLIFFLLAMASTFSADAQYTWSKQADGVLLTLKNGSQPAKTVQLRVLNDKVIHVVLSPANELSKAKSLVEIPGIPQFSGWQVKEEENKVVLQTKVLEVQIDLESSAIVFKDLSGNVLLRESLNAARSFRPVYVEGTRGYSMKQVFESPDDEGLYGLGQHQSDEFNYKGRNEDLYQYNTKVANPFIISTRNYGILWDNYSYSKFGDDREYANIDQFRLYDEKGIEQGLTARYTAEGEQKFTVRPEMTIDYENLETINHFPEGFEFNNAQITWNGFIEPKASGRFHFKLYYAGYTKVYLDDSLIVPVRWRTAWNPNTWKFTADLQAGKKYKLKVDWKPDGGVSYLGLKALSPRPPEEQNKLSIWSEMGDEIRYYFIAGQNMDEVISGYRMIAGKAPVMPKWAMGFWQSRERYKTQEELLDVFREYRKRQIPIDNIVQDWSYWPVESWGSHDFDLERFPDAKAMVDQVHQMNGRVMISVWPKFYYTTDNYKAFDNNGWMYRLAVQDSIRDWIGKGYIGSFYDAYAPGARKLFWDQINEKLYSKGFDAWWMDASEPDILSNASMVYRKKLSTPTALGPSAKFFNAYALVNAESIYNGQRGVNNNDRVFLLTRSGFAGTQRYSTATWSGDIGTRWEDLKAQISAGLNFAMTGIPYWTMDIGGFCVERRYERATEGSEDMNEWRELNTRWFQFGAFCPLFRSHGQYPFREIFNISPAGHPAYNSMVYYDKLRYRLMPYIYSLAGKTYHEDYTIMRAMVMDFGTDAATHHVGDQYMFGPSILVAPVYEYKARRREVYFPENSGWFNFETNEYVTGGQTKTVDAPYERMPLFIKAGGILVMGKDIQHTAEAQQDLTIKVYTGADGTFTIYEDAGTNYDYEKGLFSTINVTYDHSKKMLTIHEREGKYPGMFTTRKINVEWMGPGAKKFRSKSFTYSGKQVTVNL